MLSADQQMSDCEICVSAPPQQSGEPDAKPLLSGFPTYNDKCGIHRVVRSHAIERGDWLVGIGSEPHD